MTRKHLNINAYYFSILLFIVISYGLQSCSTLTKQDVVGKYRWQPTPYVISSLNLNEDHRYEFGFFYDVGGWLTHEGCWILKDNKVYLYTDQEYKNGYLDVEETSVNGDRYIEFFYQNDLSKNTPVEINDTISLKTAEDGKILLPKNLRVEKISLPYVMFKNNSYLTKDPYASYCLEEFENIPLSFFFEKEAVKVKSKSLKFLKRKYVKYNE